MIVEPLRSVLIPSFDLIKKAAMKMDVGSGISGSPIYFYFKQKERKLQIKS
jgi:homoserine kinase